MVDRFTVQPDGIGPAFIVDGMRFGVKNTIAQTVGILLAAGLTYLALRNVDFSGMWQALRDANYWWLFPIISAALFSHFLRAWRWRMFIDALPESQRVDAAPRVTLALAFNSVMIGYMINNAVPRLGEFARAANISSQARWRFSSIFGTVVIERVLDLASLILILVAVGVVVAGSEEAEVVFFGPLRSRFDSVGILEITVLAAILAAFVIGLIWLPKLLGRNSGSSKLLKRLVPMIDSFRVGFLTLFKSKKRLGIFVTTVTIWFCYWLMLYLPFHMLHMAQPFGLGSEAALVLLGIGSIGFVVPAPGGIGAYHYFVIQTLVLLYAVPYDQAASYAVLTHAAQLVLFGIGGFICLLAQGSSLSSMMQIARQARQKPVDDFVPSPSGAEGYISR